MALVLRSNVSDDLSADQIDGNFVYLQDQIDTINDALPDASRGIDDIDIVGDQITFTMTDATTIGPLTLPVADFGQVDAWQALHIYAKNTLFTANSALYIVRLNHTSAATFDENANNGMGGNYYLKIFTIPDVPSTLNDLTDVDRGVLADLDDGAALVFNETDQEFQARRLTGLDIDFDPSTDSALTSPTVGEAIEELEGLIAEDAFALSFASTDFSATDVGTALIELFDAIPDVSALAPLASPTFTGNPAAPTPSPGDNDTSIATTAFVKAAIDVVLGGVSSSFDTLSEIATSLGTKLALADIVGKQTIWVPASAMVARTTNGAAAGTVEMSSNKNMVRTLDFDASTQEFAQFDVAMPKSWNNGTVTFIPYWSHAATVTNFGVVFGVDAVAISDDDTIDVAFGTAQTSTDTGGTTNDLYAGAESSAITIAGTPATGDVVQFRVHRDPANGSDTLAVDARLHGIKILYTTNAANDS